MGLETAGGPYGGPVGGTVGADADVLASTARRFGRAALLLREHRAQLAASYLRVRWVGTDAERSRHEWQAVGSPALLRASAFLSDLEGRLLRHADEQRRASGVPSSTVVSGFGGGLGGMLDDLLDGPLDDVLDDLLDDLRGDRTPDVAPPTPRPPAGEPGPLVGARPARFDAPADGRGAILSALHGVADRQRIRHDEIEIRALDNGRYIVVLPGVTDLSAGVDQFVDRIRSRPFGIGDAGREVVDTWSDNDAPTVRKMRHAYEAALRDDTSLNEYSRATVAALRAAHVPAGAEVMLVGHSFGAYTVVDLAADAMFNSAHGADPGRYHLRVTHVVALGAEVDWRFDEVPAATRTLVSNNRFDVVYRAEDLLHRDGDAGHAGHLERNFWGGWEGRGHDERNYLEWLAGTDDVDVGVWLAEAGGRYASAGTRVSARVPDPRP